jgi:electron transfer flavoprotein alpha subunit
MGAPVVVCTWDASSAALPDETAEALTLAYRLATALGSELRLVVAGELSDGARAEAGNYGVACIDWLRAAGLEQFGQDLTTTALAKHLQSEKPVAVILAQTFDARIVAPCLAARLDGGVVMNCIDLAAEGGALLATVTAYGGDTRAVYRCSGAATYVFAIGANALAAEPLAGETRVPSVREVNVDLAGVKERVRVIERAQAAEGPRLEHAQIVVAGGRGLGTPENFRLVEELAAALGGMAGASRPIVDDGWARPAQQVGLTGKITKPALYIAAGISGASQHMVGCAAAKTLVAINRDESAAIFRYARYGVVGDCVELLPEITRAIRAKRG